MIVHDASALFVTVIDRAFLVVQVGAGLAAMLLCASWLLLPSGVKAARRRLSGSLEAADAPEAPPEPRTAPRPAQRRVPSWAHTEPYDYDHYEEAA